MNNNTNFIDPSKKSLYGKDGAQFWIGKIVGYADQKDQIENGFGWRYKVRILGDNSDTDQIEDQYLTYATVILPTTAGTGAAFKLRSVRLSQGDMVFGVRGGGTAAPKFILGSLPRTSKTVSSSGKFGTPSGFYGSLKNNGTLSGEFNEQIGPATPGVTPLDPKTYNKSNSDDPSDKVEQLGYDRNFDGEIDDVEKTLTPTTTAAEDPPSEDGAITPQQIEYALENPSLVAERDKIFDQNLSNQENALNYRSYLTKLVNQGAEQNYYESGVVKTATNYIKIGNFDKALEVLSPEDE
jgi:hypothetical protein